MTSSKNLNVSIIFGLVFIFALFNADFSITTLDPWGETKNFFGGLTQIELSKIPNYFDAIVNTIRIAIVAIFVSAILGFILAMYFHHRFVRVCLAFIRAIHELFWALLFLQIFGLNTMTALLAIILPYSATLGKVYAEILEEYDVFPKELHASKTSKISSFLYTKHPDALPHLL
ncbi:MAG: ABC transporter permease, partial [Campylobacteraceae bacterium]|nr:ABC transporter permease [Campylobacteraceae bacterium]